MTDDLQLVLATDLDGTFLHPDGSHTGHALYPMLKDNRAHLKLIYVTGRAYESILALIEDPTFPSPDYIIADVGATVLKRQGESSFTPVMPLQNRIAQCWPGHDVVLKALAQVPDLTPQEVPQERRCSFYFSEATPLERVRAIARSLDLEVLVSAGRYLDILPRNTSKGSSLQQLLELEGLPGDRVLTAGDTLNDLSLIAAPFKSVVVNNAEPALKEAALKINGSDADRRIYLSAAEGPIGILEAIHQFNFFPHLEAAHEELPVTYGDADLVIAYHRQPFDEVRKDGEYIRHRPASPNGIIPTLLGLFAAGKKGAWVAWSQMRSRNDPDFEPIVMVDETRYPNLVAARIALAPEDVSLFYKRFSKEAFWPIIFSFPERATFTEAHWVHFCEINRLFAEKVAASAAHGATVWVHDYNLWMMPSYLRDLRPDVRIHFFHHTAFPGADIFNILPWKGQIVASLLKCDYIGFHIPRYVENFVDVVRSNVNTKILKKEYCAPTYLTYGCALGVEEMTTRIQTQYGALGIGAHPVGIDNDRIRAIALKKSTQKLVGHLKKQAGAPRIILSVERLDYVKGPIEKMLAYEKLLETRPDLHGQFTMINIVTPAASGMDIYEKTRESLDRVIGRINGRFSRLGWTPVNYFYRSVPFEELVSFYLAADIAWITPLRDGLNLVCKEFVSAKAASNEAGVLVLSEFAGAAVELKGAVLTNPYDETSLIQSLLTALDLDEGERRFRMDALIQRVAAYDVHAWGEDFLCAGDAVTRLPTADEALPRAACGPAPQA